MFSSLVGQNWKVGDDSLLTKEVTEPLSAPLGPRQLPLFLIKFFPGLLTLPNLTPPFPPFYIIC